MRGSSNSTDGLALWFMKIRGLKKGESIHIQQTKALGEKKTETLKETIREISGDIHDIKFRKYTFEGDEIQELQIWLRDNNAKELYSVSINFNSIARSIMNSLLSIEGELGHLLIRVYNRKDNGFPSAYMEHNGVKIGWKYQPKDLEHLVIENTIKKKGNTIIEKDYTDLEAMLVKEIQEKVLPNIKKSSSAPVEKEHPFVSDGPTEDKEEEVEEDQLPF